jgi:hypothetical protein
VEKRKIFSFPFFPFLIFPPYTRLQQFYIKKSGYRPFPDGHLRKCEYFSCLKLVHFSDAQNMGVDAQNDGTPQAMT